jgi:glycosyltransferase involved in cell wall biosynthesis
VQTPWRSGERSENERVRILLVSQMYPSSAEPDYGVFVRRLEEALAARGHTIERAVLSSRAGGKAKYLRLAARTIAAARRFRPDVVYAHFLVPTGLIGALSSYAPLVVTAHGQDVANIGSIRGVGAATNAVVRRASAVIAVSNYLRRELEEKVPAARGKTHVVGSGVDLDRFRPSPPPDGPTAFLCLGSLTERKNVVRLAQAFAELGDGTLTFAGDGPLRTELEGVPGVRLVGLVPYDRVPAVIAEAHVVCQPSLVEPLGQALLEGMACGRSVVATAIGGPPEFVPPEAGVLVDPLDGIALAAALRAASELPCPNPVARAAAERHDVNEQARRVEEILKGALGET